MVGKGVGARAGFAVLHLQAEHAQSLPVAPVLFGNIEIGVANLARRYVNLHVLTRAEAQAFTFGQPHFKLLDKGRDIAVAHHLAVPFLDVEDGGRNGKVQILSNFQLAPQMPAPCCLLAREECRLGGQQAATALQHLAPALSARPLAATSRGKVDVARRQCGTEAAP